MAQIDALTKRKTELDAKLLTADLDKEYEGNGVHVSFTPRRTLDSALITKKFPVEKNPEFYKLTLDTPEFKKHFSAVELESFQKISHLISIKEL